MAELQSQAVRSLVHIASSILAYILVWLAAMLRPLDVQLHVVREKQRTALSC